ncbi:accelerated cell death 11 [Andrographis paniculata]|uniref:accelerated cell death 11 n=1 Tax=Andrographis paniculata TaxID=175694 RepID=UPI0021E8C99F|nr:accelerated cell death 11 [Andrographis paniculata]
MAKPQSVRRVRGRKQVQRSLVLVLLLLLLSDHSMEEEKALKRMAEAFRELANAINQCPEGEEAALQLRQFSHACSLVSPLFRCLGIAFKFAELDYVAKVDDLMQASSSILTLPVMMDGDIEANCVRKAGSHTRNLLRVKRGVDMIKVLFQHMISSEGNSLKDAASKAYAQVFAPYHGWAIRKAVGAGMYTLPTKAQLLSKLNEDEASARTQMQNYVSSTGPVVAYIDKLYMSRGLGIDW